MGGFVFKLDRTPAPSADELRDLIAKAHQDSQDKAVERYRLAARVLCAMARENPDKWEWDVYRSMVEFAEWTGADHPESDAMEMFDYFKKPLNRLQYSAWIWNEWVEWMAEVII